MTFEEGPRAGYESLVSAGTLTRDQGQELAVDKLQKLHGTLADYKAAKPLAGWKSFLPFQPKSPEAYPRGLYIFGSVGRGK